MPHPNMTTHRVPVMSCQRIYTLRICTTRPVTNPRVRSMPAVCRVCGLVASKPTVNRECVPDPIRLALDRS